MSSGNTPGRELFLKHVHLNFQGYYLLAKAVFEQIRPILPTRYVAGDIRLVFPDFHDKIVAKIV